MRPRPLLLTAAVALAVALSPSQALASAWSDVSASAALTPSPESVDPQSGVLFSDVTVENTSGAALDATLRLVVGQSNFAVLNADGTTGDAEPYFEVVAPLAPGASDVVRVEFPDLPVTLSFSVRLEQLLPSVDPIVVTSAPTLTMDPAGVAPLAGLVNASTNVPTRGTLLITNAERTLKVEYPEWETAHEMMALGLEPATSYTIEVRFADQNGATVFAPPLLKVTTPALPADFPFVGLLVSNPAAMEPGLVLLDRPGGSSAGKYAMAVEPDGDVVWFSSDGGGVMTQLPNGNLFFRDSLTAVEMDPAGRRVQETVLQTTNLHHDLNFTAHGTLLSLGGETVSVPDFPTSETDPGAPTATQDVRDESAQELLPDGTLLSVWNFRDQLDLSRIGYNSLLNCGSARGCDWIHTNAVLHDPADDSVIVSARHQDAVFKFDRATGQLVWILGTHVNWSAPFLPFLLQPQGALEWQYHQHAPMITGDGTLLLFDNGNNRTSPFDGLTPIDAEFSESRAVEYAIDETNMEVEQVWEFRFPFVDRTFSSFISDADWMPQTGNALVHFGGTRRVGGSTVADLGLGDVLSRTVEVTRTDPAQIVFDLVVFDPSSRVQIYRAAKLPSLYPANVTLTELPPMPRPKCGLGGPETLAVLWGLLAVRRLRPARAGRGSHARPRPHRPR